VSVSRVLPQLGDEVFLTDGGVETDLIFNRGIELPEFASFVVHDDTDAERVAREYFREYLRIGGTYQRGVVLETLTWRASSDWAHVSAMTHRACGPPTNAPSSSCSGSASARSARPSS